MHDYPMILIMALLILGYGVFSKKAENSIITPPMVFVLMGLFVSYFMPNLLDQSPKAGYVKPVVEFTLILILFVDGSTIDRKSLWYEKSLPSRLLGIGLPLTMVLGTLAAMWIFPEENLYMLILLALILSPTDAALGQSVVTGEKVPKKIRQTINVESGLNDGFAYPPLLICISVLALQQGLEVKEGHLLTFLLKQFILGPAIGGIVGWLGGKLIEFALKKGMMTVIYQMLESFAIAVLAFFAAEYFGGNGFIAAFVAGMMLGTRREEARERMKEFGEAGSQVMVMFIFLLFGMILVTSSAPLWDWRAWIYAAMSLTLIRMIPVWISLIGTGLDRKTVLFIGWFGPRGVASILYLLIVIITLGPDDMDRLVSVVTLTVLLSIFLHGISARPLSGIFGKGDHEN